ncbi:hypothetical protein E6Q11_05205 [Candidatus Dojkabacteria bacterium]|uniref:Uncharacterized protein n=1 Tax=Candidatus Dojkabacteria bacterium TaxID=2099670 RepID=A0A5C7J3Z2_9BACT|nr:MAG: hypothetical protein E6Q11_05205 [Candidatus Dojkabacteria bacterium]
MAELMTTQQAVIAAKKWVNNLKREHAREIISHIIQIETAMMVGSPLVSESAITNVLNNMSDELAIKLWENLQAVPDVFGGYSYN